MERNPKQNGIVEGKRIHVQENTRTMLNEVGLSNGFCKEAIDIAIYILNTDHISVNNDKTPYELCNGRLVRVKQI